MANSFFHKLKNRHVQFIVPILIGMTFTKVVREALPVGDVDGAAYPIIGRLYLLVL